MAHTKTSIDSLQVARLSSAFGLPAHALAAKLSGLFAPCAVDTVAAAANSLHCRVANGVKSADFVIPVDALGLPDAELNMRYIRPAFAALNR